MTDDEVAKKLAELEAEMRATMPVRGAAEKPSTAAPAIGADTAARREGGNAAHSRAMKPPLKQRSPQAKQPETQMTSSADKRGQHALASTPEAGPLERTPKSRGMSVGLSLFFGPIGWLYAGAWREAIPGAAAYLLFGTLLLRVLPTLIVMPALTVGLPLSAIVGYLYAAEHNRKGKRTALFLGGPRE